MTKDFINRWLERNDEAMAQAAGVLAPELIEELIGDLKEDTLLHHATDLAECDEHDIGMFFSILDDEWKTYGSGAYGRMTDKLKEPFCIKSFNSSHHGCVRDLFDNWLDENYEQLLSDELLTAVRERCDVGRIVNSKALGGGGFEVLSDLFHMTEVKVLDAIKEAIRPMRPFHPVTDPEEMEFFSIEDDGQGGKRVHLLGYTFLSDDNGDGPWRALEPCGLLIPIGEFIDGMANNDDYAENLIAEAKQYEGDYTDEGMVDYINHYFSHHPAGHYLHYSEVTADTPVGDYCFENQNG